MSGLGYHLVFPEPKGLLAKYPNAAGKHVIKKRSGDYEVHFEHWVTFTRNNDVRPGDGSGSFEKFIAPPVQGAEAARQVHERHRGRPDEGIGA